MSESTLRSRWIFQFSVVIAVTGVLAAALFNAMRFVQERAERTVVLATVRNMDSGVKLEVARRVMNGVEATIPSLVGGNPTEWLTGVPEGYVGNCTGDLVEGGWCFDQASREIVYRPVLDRYLKYPQEGQKMLRWRISSSAEMAGRRSVEGRAVGAIGIVSTTSFEW